MVPDMTAQWLSRGRMEFVGSLLMRMGWWGCRRGNTGGMVVSPITGELVPIEQMGEHMRISLIDPRC